MTNRECTVVFFAILLVIIISVAGDILNVNKYRQSIKQDIIQEEALQQKISDLQTLLYWSRKANAMSLILEQILTPLQVRELQALNEQIKQKKENKCQ